MESYSPGRDVQAEEEKAVHSVLRSYYEALEDGSAASIVPKPKYAWRFWQGGLTLERMRRGIQQLDDYLNERPQHDWAENNAPGGAVKFDAGPDISRLPDAALIALFQELDAALARFIKP